MLGGRNIVKLMGLEKLIWNFNLFTIFLIFVNFYINLSHLTLLCSFSDWACKLEWYADVLLKYCMIYVCGVCPIGRLLLFAWLVFEIKIAVQKFCFVLQSNPFCFLNVLFLFLFSNRAIRFTQVYQVKMKFNQV